VDLDLDDLLSGNPYALAQGAKEPRLLAGLNALTAHHRDRCQAYRRILGAAWGGRVRSDGTEEVPYLPVGLFKKLDLRSIPDDQVFKTLQSSGTTGQVVSRIALDVETARLQTRALASIMGHFLGPKRRPMIIIDHAGVVRDRRQFSARGAGILGMMSHGRDHFYALDESMALDLPGLTRWLASHAGEDLLLFGFTFMVWQYFCLPLQDAGIDLSRGILIHSGGWKSLQDRAVTNESFKTALGQATGLARVHNFYGMVEQVGSVYVECEAGFFHAPAFAEVVPRDPHRWGAARIGETGVIEVLSLLPRSYPGHALLTEDLGTVHGVDDCACGRKGRYFTIAGRVPRVEIRGCGDTHAHDRRPAA
jgi:hypothetical protein